ncbi:hypothetical protein [Wenyingzhuangia aestuarii]|uniref:hypothetical protein n=1 Tax=Wenyingzhuangia aestuarii TaxID=1647582 RepID=UPI001ADC3B2A|nr:hypothetical protein [Wenyingzhuangia aestuarii]NJB81841.1 hypothetical protein [Wenyingzhuangia aestuarii]
MRIAMHYKRALLAMVLMLIVFTVCLLTTTAYSQNEKENKMNVQFINITEDHVKNSFLEVYKKYDDLHAYKITVIQKRIGATTMKAQPIITFKNLCKGTKEYRIVIGEFLKDTDIKLSEVPKDVLKGWFAHELGHVVDYEQHSNFGMLWYGLRYVTSGSFKKKVEHKADYIALKKGFKNSLLKTKRYILLSDVFSSKYLINMNKYYLPLDSVKNYLDEKVEKDDEALSKMYHD